MSGRINFFNNESSEKRHYEIEFGIMDILAEKCVKSALFSLSFCSVRLF